MTRTRSGSPLLFDLPLRPDFSLEAGLARRGFAAIAGLDEAGRGPLAGPVVAAAVILDPANLPLGLDDSKRMSERAREAAFIKILAMARAVAFASVCAAEIDRTDIRKASLEAMRCAAAALSLKPDFALADGRDVPPGLGISAQALVKGDQRSLSIAAASIIAKVMRDRMMVTASAQWPRYGFESHKGYGSSGHMAAIAEFGPAPGLHRLSFSPLRENKNAAPKDGV